jgi:hypothetical protein
MLGWSLGFDDKVTRMTREAANADPGVWLWFDYDPAEQLEFAKTRPTTTARREKPAAWRKLHMVGSGDTTTVISDPNNKTQPYRFKEGTKAGQKAEIRRVMEERFQRDNKAPWKVGIDVAEN